MFYITEKELNDIFQRYHDQADKGNLSKEYYCGVLDLKRDIKHFVAEKMGNKEQFPILDKKEYPFVLAANCLSKLTGCEQHVALKMVSALTDEEAEKLSKGLFDELN